MQNIMNTHFSNMALGQHTSQVNVAQKPPCWCEICSGSDHSAKICGENPDSINFVGNAQRRSDQQNYGKSYNQIWQNQQNFSCGGNQNQCQGQNQYRPQSKSQRYQGQVQREQPKPQLGNMSVEDMSKKIMEDQALLVVDVWNK